MNALIIQNTNLPATMEDLSRFVLVGREKYNSVRAEIRAIDKLKLAEEVRNQKREEAQMLSEVILDAEVRLGELFKDIPPKQGKRTDIEHSNIGVTMLEKPKEERLNDLGFSKMQANRLETLADHKDLVEVVKAEARENGEFPTRARVFELAANHKDESGGISGEPRFIDATNMEQETEENCDEYDEFIDLRVNVYKELSKIIDLADKFEITPHRMDALRDNFDDILRIDDQIRYINETIEKLNKIKMEIWKGNKHGKKL